MINSDRRPRQENERETANPATKIEQPTSSAAKNVIAFQLRFGVYFQITIIFEWTNEKENILFYYFRNDVNKPIIITES